MKRVTVWVGMLFVVSVIGVFGLSQRGRVVEDDASYEQQPPTTECPVLVEDGILCPYDTRWPFPAPAGPVPDFESLPYVGDPEDPSKVFDPAESEAEYLRATEDLRQESLYRMRNGDVSLGEIPARIYIERSVSAGLGDYDADGDGWALVGRSNGDGDNGIITSSWFGFGQPVVTVRHPQKGCLQLAPVSLAKVEKGQTRLLKEVAQNTDLCRIALPEDDIDGDGQPDNVQPLYRARNGDPTKGELAARVYVERNLHASEAQIGVSDFDPDGDGWALMGRTNGAGDNGEYVSIAMNGTTPLVKIQHPTKGCITVSPISIELVKRGQTRFVTITSQTPGTCA
jgi:hypothetical protein